MSRDNSRSQVEARIDEPDEVGERIDSDASITLTRRGSLWLLELLENPPPRNAKFLTALAHYRREVGCSGV